MLSKNDGAGRRHRVPAGRTAGPAPRASLLSSSARVRQVAEGGVRQGEHRGALRRAAPGLDVGGPYLGVVVQHHGAVGAQPGVHLGAVGPGLQGGEHGTDAVLRPGWSPSSQSPRWATTSGLVGGHGGGQRRYASARKP